MLKEMTTFKQIQNILDHSTMKKIKRTLGIKCPINRIRYSIDKTDSSVQGAQRGVCLRNVLF